MVALRGMWLIGNWHVRRSLMPRSQAWATATRCCLGLRRFTRPDLSEPDYSSSDSQQAASVWHFLAQDLSGDRPDRSTNRRALCATIMDLLGDLCFFTCLRCRFTVGLRYFIFLQYHYDLLGSGSVHLPVFSFLHCYWYRFCRAYT